MYEVLNLVRVFEPNFAAAHANAALINRLSVITPLNALDMLDGMKQELPLYLAAAANAPTFDKGSVADYSDAVLGWWRANGSSFKGVGAGRARHLCHLTQFGFLRASLLPAQATVWRAANQFTG